MIPGICDACRANPQQTTSELLLRVRKTEGKLRNVQLICSSCCGTAPAEPIKCESLDCPWFFERKKVENKAEGLAAIEDLIQELEEQADVEDGTQEGDDEDDEEALFWGGGEEVSAEDIYSSDDAPSPEID